VDLSGFIFVALAVAWAVYLIPKALKHHDEVSKSRSVDRFSHTMRVLARREPVTRRDARLVVTPSRSASSPVVEVKGPRPSPVMVRARREAARRAAARRRRVFGVLLLGNVVVAGLAFAAVVDWVWQAVPGGLLVAWLVACRLMVRSERAAWAAVASPGAEADPASSSLAPAPAEPEVEFDVERNEEGFDEAAFNAAETGTVPAVGGLWDPLPVTLPTYVSKPAAARRTVRTIDLGEPGAWTSGRTEEASAIAREAAAAAAAARTTPTEGQRAVGS
jgi:hypothetical protein